MPYLYDAKVTTVVVVDEEHPAERLKVDLMVMGGYGHSRLREMLLGGVTYDLLHQAPVPLIIAH
jgi:nucleotide-binding universal stress UspA family protein